MSSGRIIYKKNQIHKHGDYDFHESSPVESVDHDADNDDYEYLQEVPYSSSSIDRSSIGSIPWAEDAIKQNQMDWDRIERMISGEEPLPDEPELRNEIIDWQRKFPQLLGKKNPSIQPALEEQELKSFDSSHTIDDIADDTLDDTLTILSENSLEDDEYDKFDGLATPTQRQLETFKKLSKRNRFATSDRPQYSADNDLVDLLDRDLHITAYPMQQRHSSAIKPQNDLVHKSGKMSSSPLKSHNKMVFKLSKPLSTKSAVEHETNTRLRMPPISNTLQIKRPFNGLDGNRSFVQLTQIHQAKSAAERHNNNVQRITAWQSPMTISTNNNRLQHNNNNRNAIILPAINMQYRNAEHLTNRQVPSMIHNTRTNSSSSRNSTLHHYLGALDHKQTARSNSSITPPTGRSVSAAVHRSGLSSFYLPNSASKYKVFK